MTEPPATPSQPIAPEVAPGGPSPSWYREVSFHSLLAGLTPLIPIPFVDDRVLEAIHRRMVRSLADDLGLRLDRDQVRRLTDPQEAEKNACLGCLLGGLIKFVIKLVSKVFRKLLIFLAIKDTVDQAGKTFVEGYLLHVALRDVARVAAATPADARPAADLARPGAVRRALDATLAEVDPRPVHQAIRGTLRGSRSVLVSGARLLARPFRGRKAGEREADIERADQAIDQVDREERELLEGTADRMGDAVGQEQGFLEATEAIFRRHLAAERARAEQPAPSAVEGG